MEWKDDREWGYRKGIRVWDVKGKHTYIDR